MASKHYFTPGIDRFFAAWIMKETWFKNHPTDRELFYHFVHAVHRFSKRQKIKGHEPTRNDLQRSRRWRSDYDRNQRTYDEKALREKITIAAVRNHGFVESTAEAYAMKFAADAMLLLEFLHTIEHPTVPPCDISRAKPSLR